VQAPCGIEAPNLLCVGALNPDGRRTRFTNLPFIEGPVVFAPGYEILSLKPADTCPELYSFLDTLDAAKDGTQALCKFDTDSGAWKPNGEAIGRYRPVIRELVRVCSSKKNLYLPMSGTSMATPLVSRMAAEVWLENPGVTRAADLIPLLVRRFARQDGGDSRGRPLNSLSPPIPSWYGSNSFFKEDWDPSKFRSEPEPSRQVMANEGFPVSITPTMGRIAK
jgi:subtilisin family serine protease